MAEKQATSEESPGVALRRTALTTPATDLGFESDTDFPRVYGVLTDWDVGGTIATVMSMRDGTASLYTTSTFGVMGGQEHESVRQAATRYVAIAEQFVDASEPVTDFTYPESDQVYYYLLTYEGVRRCTANISALEKMADPTTPLFAAAQEVLTELRMLTEKESAEP